MVNSSIVSLGVIVLLSGLVGLGSTILGVVNSVNRDPNFKGYNSCGSSPNELSCTDVVGVSIHLLANLSFPVAYGTISLSLGMCVAGIAIIMIGSGQSSMMGGRR
jgi:hypothetical protein